jgi:hypothetical protein
MVVTCTQSFYAHAAAERDALIDPMKSNHRKTTWNFNRSPVARHSDANAAAAAAAAASSSSAATQGPVMHGVGVSAAVVTPVMEARFKLEQVMSAVQK